MEGSEPAVVAGSTTFAFDDVVVDIDGFELQRAGEPVDIEPQVFDVLCYLIEHRNRVVSKVELLDNVWGDRFVSESALTSRIRSARQAVGDDGRQQRIIRTTHGRGYRFVADVIDLTDGAGADDRVGDIDGDTEPSTAADQTPSIAHRSSVPAPARPLVARDDELASLMALLENNRLVSVVGTGGVGKTRLSIEVAARWDQEFDDLVTFVALAPLSAADEVFTAIRDALGIRAGGSVDAFGAVGEALANKSALLVLDNFEHVVDAATTLADLVALAPGVRLLVTSRERLGLTGEQVLELEPFTLAPNTSTGGSAVTFFEHSVRRVRSDIALDAEHRDDIVAICQTLDALPLAIELAAAQTKYFPLSYLRSHLKSAAISVADPARDRPERHHTMQSTIGWSYQLLTPNQQRLLAALSVCRGSWPFGASEAMTSSEDATAATRDLLALVDKSLVQRSTGPLGEPRFSMLSLVREFAEAELAALGARTEAFNRHAAFVATTMQTLADLRWAGTGDSWIDAINGDYPNAVAALNWCFDGGGDPVVGCQIVKAIGFWLYRTGRLAEGGGWIDRALANLSVADDATAAWVHSAAGTRAAFELRRHDSQQHFELALDMARQLGDQRLESMSLCDVGNMMDVGPNSDTSSVDFIRRGLDLARRIDSPQCIAHALTTLGELSRARGQAEAAEAAYGEALELSERIGDRHYEAVNTLNSAHALLAQGRIEESLGHYRQGIELASALGNRLMMAWNLAGLAVAFQLLDRPELAARLIGTAQTTLDALGSTLGLVDQPIQDRAEAALIGTLGIEDYENLVAEGTRLSLEDGVDMASDESKLLPAGP
jgi:predicted ATPase/DNA-binding winged helix-turn-helix (wHTH) protein